MSSPQADPCASMSDTAMAFFVGMLSRQDVQHEYIVTGASNRIRALSQQNKEIKELLVEAAHLFMQGPCSPMQKIDWVQRCTELTKE